MISRFVALLWLSGGDSGVHELDGPLFVQRELKEGTREVPRYCPLKVKIGSASARTCRYSLNLSNVSSKD